MKSFIDVLLMRWLVLNSAGAVLLWYGYDTGVLQDTFYLDATYISEAIVVVFALGFLLCSYRILRVSQALNSSILGRHTIYPLKREHYLITTEIHISSIARVQNLLLLIGIAGTMYGLIQAVSGVDLSALGNASKVGGELAKMMSGLHTMFVTTLTGLLTAAWLGIHLTVLENAYRKLYVVRGGGHVSP